MLQTDINLLTEVYQGCQMGIESMDGIIPKLKQQDDLTLVLNNYMRDLVEIQNKVISVASTGNEPIEQSGIMEKAFVKGSTKLNMLVDDSANHVAEMIIKGSAMGITSIQGKLNQNKNASEEVKKLAEHMIFLQEENMEKMKKFLG